MSDLHALTAREAGLVACRLCSRVWPGGTPRCARCGAALQSRDPLALSRVWAWWVAGVMAYVPANLWPMIAGALELWAGGARGVALIILAASVLIPLLKFFAIAYLALSATRPVLLSPHARLRLYEVVEYIGRWSMIDVFVVAILASLVQLDVVASIQPGPASLAFALSVISTMLSAQAFDPRALWDGIERDAAAPARAPA